MSMPAQMFDHVVDATKGLVVSTSFALTHELAIEETDNNKAMKRGMVGYRDPDTKSFVRGLPATGNVMPLFARHSFDDLSVRADGAPGMQGGSASFGNNKGISTFPCTGAIALFTTEVSGSIDTLRANDFLTAGLSTDADSGMLKKGAEYADLICGIFIDADMHYQGAAGIHLWPFYLPRLTKATVDALV